MWINLNRKTGLYRGMSRGKGREGKKKRRTKKKGCPCLPLLASHKVGMWTNSIQKLTWNGKKNRESESCFNSDLVVGPEPLFKLSGCAQVQENFGDEAETNAATWVVLCPRLNASNVPFISHICCLCFTRQPALERDIDWHAEQIPFNSMRQYCPWYQNTSCLCLT